MGAKVTMTVLAAALAHGCGGVAPHCEATSDTIVGSNAFTLEPGGFAEANVVLEAGQILLVEFAASGGRLGWNLHTHDVTGATTILDEGESSEGCIEFLADADGELSVLWTNERSSAVTLEVELRGDAFLLGWAP